MKNRFNLSDIVIPNIGRAGLGNELFPYMRSLDLSKESNAKLLPPRWLQIRIGPTLRGEHDRRQYWKLFNAPKMSEFIVRLLARAIIVVPLFGLVLPKLSIHEVEGMGNYFDDLSNPPSFYRTFLRTQSRRGVLSTPIAEKYFSIHIRLGDFQRTAENDISLSGNNYSTPLSWYVKTVQALRKTYPKVPIIVSSDGTANELSDILEIEGVKRSNALNALDEIFLLSNSVGMLGSRSTFTAWGAFLGEVPLLVMQGGNSYFPHSHVWETVAGDLPQTWQDIVSTRLLIEAK